MRTHIRGLCAVFVLCVLLLAPSHGAVGANQVSLIDQGWNFGESDGKRAVVLNCLVVNESPSALSYEVRFSVERLKNSGTNPVPGKKGNPADPSWEVVKTVSVQGGPLRSGGSDAVKATIPSDLLTPGKTYRFRADLVDRQTGAVLAASVGITPSLNPFGSFAGGMISVAGASAIMSSNPPSGSGLMTGQHEARRVGGEWIERGSGTINLRTSHGRMVLQYSYTAHGTSAASLTASATATGQLVRLGAPPLPVVVSSASAQMTFPGARQQTGQVIRRTGATATGTFSGTVGGQPWSGLLTMTNGTQTLDLATDKGQHNFGIQFTASQ